MNLRASVRVLAVAVMSCAILAAAPEESFAKRRMGFNVEAKDLREGDLVVPKGETYNDDVAATGAVIVDGSVNGDCVSLGNSVTVRGEVRGDVAAVGGSADVSGTVNGDLAVMGGPVSISGLVRGEVAAMGGDVSLSSRAVVEGDVAMMGGRLHKAEGATIKGSVTKLDLGLAKAFLPLAAKLRHVPEMTGKLSPFRRVVEFFMFLVLLAGGGVVALLLTLFLPEHVEKVAVTIKKDFWKSAGIGVVILMCTFPGLLLMAVSILGIPLIPVAILVYSAAVFVALAGFCRVLAWRLSEARNRPDVATVAGVGQGYLLLAGLLALGKLIQHAGGLGALLGGIFVLAGLVLLSCGMVVGMGAVWTTRFGSREGQAVGSAIQSR